MEQRDTNINEIIVFIIRETGWSLAYVKTEILSLPVKTLNLFLAELRYQKAVEEYRLLRAVATGVAIWASSREQGRRYTPEDFIGHEPTREEINRR